MIDFVYDPIIGLKYYYFGPESVFDKPITFITPELGGIKPPKKKVEIQRKILKPNKLKVNE